MNPEHLDVHAAIRLALPASGTAAAGQVRHDVYRVSRPQRGACGCLLYRAGQLVPHHSWIAQVGLGAREDMHVRAADANAPHTHQHFLVSSPRCLALLGAQSSGSITDDSQHIDPSDEYRLWAEGERRSARSQTSVEMEDHEHESPVVGLT